MGQMDFGLFLRTNRDDMKWNRSFLVALVLMVLTTALYRIFPRPLGFAPQIALALFAGAIFVKDKKWAFVLPLVSMLVSDALYQVLYGMGWSDIPGFYKGQALNYLLFAGITVLGFTIRENSWLSKGIAAVVAPTLFFLVSNGLVWWKGGGWQRPKTFDGLVQTYVDGLPFYPNSIYATVFFGLILFTAYRLLVPRSAAEMAS